MSLLWEKWYPFVFAIISCVAWWLYSLDLKDLFSFKFTILKELFPTDKAPILSASLTFGAILCGFLATTQSILMGINGEIKKELDRSGYIEDLSSYLSQGIVFSLSFSFISLVGFFKFSYLLQVIWLFLSVASLLAFLRVTKITLTILRVKDN